MGCGASNPITDTVLEELVKFDKIGRLSSSVTPAVFVQIKQVATDAIHDNLLVKIRDQAKTVARTGAEGAHEPPEGEPLDGLLGIIKTDSISKIKDGLGPDNPFCDTKFTAENSSLYFSDNKKDDDHSQIYWLRPKDMTPEPNFVVNNITKKDVIQGRIGDCWFLSAVAAIATKPHWMQKVIPKGQVLYGKDYTGLLVFRFWRFGNWITVCIDDQLPTKNGNLMYGHCNDPKQFWVALLEKAYAKLYGSYEAIEGGNPMDAMVDMTGGLAENYSVSENQKDLYRKLLRARSNGCFITCSKTGEWSNTNLADSKGLVSGHAYTVTHVTTVTVPTRSGNYVKLIRIRNPWGNSSEWKGNWSDSSSNWKLVDNSIKKNLEVEDCPDGEFWMSFTDFCMEFHEVSICTVGHETDEDGEGNNKKKVTVVKSAWELGKNCGGSRNNVQKFSQNPQFLLSISEQVSFDEDEDVDISGRRNLLVSLMQEHRRSKNKFGLKFAHIGFAVYKAEDTEKRLPTEYFLIHSDMGTSGHHVNTREVIGRFHLVPGKYIIIPSTFEPDCPRPFLLRIYCDQKFQVRELKEGAASNERSIQKML